MDVKKTFKKTLQFIICLGVGLLLLWISFREVNYEELLEGLGNAHYSWLILALIFGFLAYYVRAIRWKLLIDPMGYKPSLSNTFHALMFGYLANAALPRVGEVTRCVALGRKESVPIDKLFGTVVIERSIDLLSMLIITVALVIWASDGINQFLNASIFQPLQEKVFSIFDINWIFWLALFIIVAIPLFFLIRNRKRLGQTKLFSKLFGIAKGFIDGLRTIVSMKKKGYFVLCTIVIWVNYTLMTWLAYFALDGVDKLGFGNVIFLLVLGSVGMAVPVQGGFGSFHYFISRGLAFINGVSINEGLTYAILSHESQLIMVLVIGAISTFVMFGKRRNSKEPTVDPTKPEE